VELQHVLAHLPRLVIKPAFPTRSIEAVFGADLSKAQLEQLAAKISARPPTTSRRSGRFRTPPGAAHEQIQPRRFVVRAYWRRRRLVHVMTGGLTRITSSAERSSSRCKRGRQQGHVDPVRRPGEGDDAARAVDAVRWT